MLKLIYFNNSFSVQINTIQFYDIFCFSININIFLRNFDFLEFLIYNFYFI